MSDMFYERVKVDLPSIFSRLLHHNVTLKDLDEAVEEVTKKDCDLVAKEQTKEEFKRTTEKAMIVLMKKRKIPMLA